jgi:hypothetical protein
VGFSVFTALHPQNVLHWKQVVDARIDPLSQFDKKSIEPRMAARDHHDKDRPSASSRNEEGKTAAATTLPLESGLAVSCRFCGPPLALRRADR